MAYSPDYAEKTVMEFESLMARALKNEKADFLRANGKRLENERVFSDISGNMADLLIDSEADTGFLLVDSSFMPTRYAMTVTNAKLDEALSRLDETQRVVAILAFGYGLSCAEIAEETGLVVHKVKRTRRKALAELKRFMMGAM
jgi:RNA polymerase sigma factor (sigma-70 family)